MTPGPSEQQPNETDRAYQAFRIYLEQGAGRSTAKVGERLGHRSSKQSEKWSAKYGWVDRVRRFEAGVARRADEEYGDEAAKRARAHALEAQTLGAATVQIGRELLRRVQENPGALRGLPLEDLVRVIPRAALAHNRAVLTERLSRGMTTDQPGEPLPRTLAEEQARRMTREELDAALAGLDDGPVDELAELRDRKAAGE